MTIDTQEALRLLDEMHYAIDGDDNDWSTIQDSYKELRALLSAKEPTAEHWRQAIGEWGRDPVAGGIELEHNLAWIEQRARELAKQTNCTASDDTPSKSRAKRIEKQREAPQ